MKYLTLVLILFSVACSVAPKQQKQSKMLQCKILCQGGDTYAFNEEYVNCQCKKPETPKVVNNYYGLPDPGKGTLLVLDNGRFIMSKVKGGK